MAFFLAASSLSSLSQAFSALTSSSGFGVAFDPWWPSGDTDLVDLVQRPPKPVVLDMLALVTLAKDNQQVMELRTGHSDKGARTAMGMNFSKLRDRVVGEYSI